MSLDLTLIPVEHDAGESGFGHSLLRCDAGGWLQELFEQAGIKERDLVPRKFSTYTSREFVKVHGTGYDFEEPHYGETKETPYGQPLLGVRAGDLLDDRIIVAITNEGSLKNKAVWAYLGQLKPDTKIALYWS